MVAAGDKRCRGSVCSGTVAKTLMVKTLTVKTLMVKLTRDETPMTSARGLRA
jgi:hypothetical protein